MKVFVISREGNATSEIISIKRNSDNAIKKARRLAETCVDDYHTYNVEVFETDEHRPVRRNGIGWERGEQRKKESLIAWFRKNESGWIKEGYVPKKAAKFVNKKTPPFFF